jgi:hypothetical protein
MWSLSLRRTERDGHAQHASALAIISSEAIGVVFWFDAPQSARTRTPGAPTNWSTIPGGRLGALQAAEAVRSETFRG